MSEDHNQIAVSPPASASPVRPFLAILFRRRTMILAIFFTIAAVVSLGTLLMPKRYESAMKILVKNERTELIVTPNRTGADPVDRNVSEAQINSEIELLTTDDLLEELVRRCGLQRLQEGSLLGGSEPEDVAVARALRGLRRDLSITGVSKAPIIHVTYESPDPDLAAKVLRELSALYLAKHREVNRTPGALQLFTAQAGSFHDQLREAEAALTDYKLSHGIHAYDRQQELMLHELMSAESRLQETEVALHEATQRTAQLKERLDSQQPRIQTQIRSMPNQYSVQSLSTVLVELKNRRTELRTKFQDDDRLVQQVDRQIADTEAALVRAEEAVATESQTDVNPIHQHLMLELERAELAQTSARARRSELLNQVNAQRQRLAELQAGSGEYEDLSRRVADLQNNYLLYSGKQEEARISESIDATKIANVIIAAAPSTPRLPSSPNVSLNILLGLMLAGFVSVGSALAAEYASSAVRTPRDVEMWTGLPALATVPDHGSMVRA